MKNVFGALCCVTFLATALAYTPFFRSLEHQDSKSIALVGEASEYGATKATRLTAVGWESCKFCQQFKTEVIPTLQAEGYEVEYVDRDLWDGPRIRMGPTLFFYGERGMVIRIHQGFLTAEQVKEYLQPIYE